ncbi:MAG: DUF1326 domain-containing protein [Rhodospirillaceae bacterium]|nr:DUF1326 domain-containing protein [Rhodospirillaceae bacterium]
MTTWSIKGREIVHCNCTYGCPCQFNARPTQGDCQAVAGFQVDEGMHGDVSLDGLRAAMIVSWPGAIHEGNGSMQIVIDERADARQRNSLDRIMRGQDTRDMATMWWIFSAMCPDKRETLYRPIDLHIDVEARTGRLAIPGLVELSARPIRNPVTKAEHRALIELPHGFEFRKAEMASGSCAVTGPIPMTMTDSHAHFAFLHLGDSGVID